MSVISDMERLSREDKTKLLSSATQIGEMNANTRMAQFIWDRNDGGVYVINVRCTWEKLVLAARAITAIENPADVCVVSSQPNAQPAIIKFANHIGATRITGCLTPGTFTKQIQEAFKEPRLLVVTDPRIDHQAITEASHVNIPILSFCNTDSPTKFIDIAIPCNNKGQKSIGLMLWFLAREVLVSRGSIGRATGFLLDGKEVQPDDYIYASSPTTDDHLDYPLIHVLRQWQDEKHYWVAKMLQVLFVEGIDALSKRQVRVALVHAEHSDYQWASQQEKAINEGIISGLTWALTQAAKLLKWSHNMEEDRDRFIQNYHAIINKLINCGIYTNEFGNYFFLKKRELTKRYTDLIKEYFE